MEYETRYESPIAFLNVSGEAVDDYKIRMYRWVRSLDGAPVESDDEFFDDGRIALSNYSKDKTQDGWISPEYTRVDDVDLIILNDLDVKRYGKHLWLTPSESASQVRRRIIALGAVLTVVLALILWRSAYLSLSDANRNRTNFVLMTRTPISLTRLEHQSKLINEMSRHIGDYRLKDIVGLLSDTANMASNANLELKAQFDAWMEINKRTAADAEVYRDMQRSLVATSQLQAKEIDRLHAVLDDAAKPELLYSIMWLIFSFFGGIITSITADKVKGRVNVAIGSLVQAIRRMTFWYKNGN